MSTITLKLKRVDPVKYAVIVSILTVLLILITVMPFMLIFSAVGASSDFGSGAAIFGGGIAMLILVPLIYGVIAFIVTLLATLLLNYILKKTGGLNMDFEKSGLDISMIGKESSTDLIQ